MRLIDGDKLIKDIDYSADMGGALGKVAECAKYYAKFMVASAPTIEEHKGKWIWNWDKFDIDTANEAVCSKCKKISAMPVGYFCKWCGADMRGEEHGTDI